MSYTHTHSTYYHDSIVWAGWDLVLLFPPWLGPNWSLGRIPIRTYTTDFRSSSIHKNKKRREKRARKRWWWRSSTRTTHHTKWQSIKLYKRKRENRRKKKSKEMHHFRSGWHAEVSSSFVTPPVSQIDERNSFTFSLYSIRRIEKGNRKIWFNFFLFVIFSALIRHSHSRQVIVDIWLTISDS